jgi:hypothetical protein
VRTLTPAGSRPAPARAAAGSTAAGRGGVVGAVRVEERGEQLDLAAADADLAHAAAVDDHVALGHDLVDLEQRAEVADAARLDVDRPRPQRHRVEVRGGVDRRVVGDPVPGAPEQRGDLREVVRVLEQRVREQLHRALVHGEQRALLAGVEPVMALEVDDLDGARGGDLRHQLGRPRVREVDLEAQVRMDLQPPGDRVERRRVAEPQRVDEAQRRRLAAQHLVQRLAHLREREVERGRLERPVAPAPRGLPLGRHRELIHRGEVVAEGLQGPRAHEPEVGSQHMQRVLVALVQRDVLAMALGAAADQPHERRDPLEPVGERRRLPLERHGLDLQRELPQPLPRVSHRGNDTGRRALPTRGARRRVSGWRTPAG